MLQFLSLLHASASTAIRLTERETKSSEKIDMLQKCCLILKQYVFSFILPSEDERSRFETHDAGPKKLDQTAAIHNLPHLEFNLADKSIATRLEKNWKEKGS